jgi:seryl-tRNA synthetase
VPVTNLCANRSSRPDTLPLATRAHTPCFRSEAGSYGKDTRGMIRQHQFEKVELVHVARPRSRTPTRELTATPRRCCRLELPYRVVRCARATWASRSAKTYDLEVWLPAQNVSRDLSCSNCEAFQARRMQARWRNRHGKPSSCTR